MERLTIEISKNAPIHEQAVEIVERKGVGHPDYICDAVMEGISVALCREYMKRFGRVLHHNIDKGLLAAGRVEKRFGGGRVVAPMELIIGDRATFEAGRSKVPVAGIAKRSVREWISRNLRNVDPERHLKTRVVLRPGSVELAGLFRAGGDDALQGANDTSAAIGYAPFTPTEKAVYECERFLNSLAFKDAFPETGEDVKVMGVRSGDSLDLTVAMPLLCRMIRSEKEYFTRKKAVERTLKKFLGAMPFREIKLNYNTLDRPGQGMGGAYMTLLGTSAEDADSGQVGRGNRPNGVISLNRPTGTEAAAGKNPTSHVGKIYTILTHRMADEIYRRVDGLAEVYVWLLSQIGSPVDSPKKISVELVPAKRLQKARVTKEVSAIVEESISGMGRFIGELTRGEHPVC